MSVSMNTAEMFTPVAQNRDLALCVLVSFALHALVLLLPAPPPGTPARAAAKILTATFAPRPTPAEPAVAAADLTRRRARETVVPKPELTPQPDTSRPAFSALSPAVPGAPDVSETPAAPVETAASERSAATGTMAPGPSRPAETQPAATAADSARVHSDADPGTLDKYRLALIVAAKRYKRYPVQALDQGWQGKVEVRLVIGADGAIQRSLVKASSGYEILDNEAMDMLKKAKPLTPIPAALRGREFTVDIPVIFDLQAG